jgi:hypothetical protein
VEDYSQASRPLLNLLSVTLGGDLSQNINADAPQTTSGVQEQQLAAQMAEQIRRTEEFPRDAGFDG